MKKGDPMNKSISRNKDIAMNRNKSKKKSILKILFCLLLFGVVGVVAVFGINGFVRASVKDRIISAKEGAELEDVDCVLVLGAGVWDNQRPSHMLEDRLLQGIELYEIGVSNRLLMSGDHGRVNYDEVNIMKKFAIDEGVPSGNVFMDHAGFSTYESLYRARDIFKAKKIIIVTQGYHLYRALYIANAMGLEAYGVAADPRQYAGQDYREARESLARVKDFFSVIAKPKPTYLGEAISVNGNGDITND